MEFLKNVKITPARSAEVAYFSMEFAFSADIPNYAGGLGVLAADYMYAIADKNYPAVGVGLIYHQDEDEMRKFHPEHFMKRMPETVKVRIEDREVTVGAYEYEATTPSGNKALVYFLTTFSGDNPVWDRDITRYLYPSNPYHRIAQEAILGIGGVRMLEKLGYKNLKYHHLNEGHAAFSTLELLKKYNYDDKKVKKVTRFTTHTPVAAGHDKWDYDLAYQVLGDQIPWHIRELATDDQLHMTHLAMNLSGRTNGVAKSHQKVCENMFPDHEFEGITNGVHHVRWAAQPTRKMLDAYLPTWRKNPSVLSQVPKKVPIKALEAARYENKHALIDWINSNPGFYHFEGNLRQSDLFDPSWLTIVFARRFVPYKRPLLIMRDIERLRQVAGKKVQIVFAGNCHPDDNFCTNRKESLRHFAEQLRGDVKIASIPSYNVRIARTLVSGANIWLNNPIPPREASGTSGMKAALNGGLNLSVLDGWWIEGMKRRPTAGWGFGKMDPNESDEQRDDRHASELYDALEEAIEVFYKRPDEWMEKSLQSMALLGHFNAHRCIDEYDKVMWTK